MEKGGSNRAHKSSITVVLWALGTLLVGFVLGWVAASSGGPKAGAMIWNDIDCNTGLAALRTENELLRKKLDTVKSLSSMLEEG